MRTSKTCRSNHLGHHNANGGITFQRGSARSWLRGREGRDCGSRALRKPALVRGWALSREVASASRAAPILASRGYVRRCTSSAERASTAGAPTDESRRPGAVDRVAAIGARGVLVLAAIAVLAVIAPVITSGGGLGATNRFPTHPADIIAPLTVQTTANFSSAIIAESTLSFLGLGNQPPTPCWGLILNGGRRYLSQAPWIALAAGTAITLCVLAVNLLATGYGTRSIRSIDRTERLPASHTDVRPRGWVGPDLAIDPFSRLSQGVDGIARSWVCKTARHQAFAAATRARYCPWPFGPTSLPSRWTTVPRTIVKRGQPRSFMPSYTEKSAQV